MGRKQIKSFTLEKEVITALERESTNTKTSQSNIVNSMLKNKFLKNKTK